MATNVKEFVDQNLGIRATLRIPNVNSDNSYVRFGRNFDNMRVKGEDNVIENISHLKNSFNNVSSDKQVHIFDVIRDVQDFEL